MSTSADLIRSLSALTPQPGHGKLLGAARPATPIAATRGRVSLAGSEATGKTVETNYADRAYHPVTRVTSSDGLFELDWMPLKRIKFTSPDGAEMVLEFAAPPVP